MAQVAILKKYSINYWKRFRLWIVLFELERHNVKLSLLSPATDNIHIVLENDNTVLIKRT